jgi:hypothetical protein
MWAPFVSLLALLTLAAAAGGARGVSQDALVIVRERTFSYDMRLAPETLAVPPSSGAPGAAWRREVRSQFLQGGGRDGIRVEISFDGMPAAADSLRVLDPAGREIEVLSTLPRQLWTREVPGGVAIIEFVRGAAGASPGATLRYAHHVNPIEQQAITGRNQLRRIADAPARIRTLGRAIARLRFMVPGEGQATCTGFLVGSRLLLTNEHCISNDAERASALADFNYDQPGPPPAGIRVQAIVAKDAGLDYSLLRLAADPPAAAGRLYFAPDGWQWALPPARHPLVIVQHPSGRPKEVSIADCQLAGLDRIGVTPGDASDFGHLCDTLGGSSGSPVMDWTTGLVVGLHHFGFHPGSPDPVNQAVVHTRILAHVRASDAAAHAEMARPRP